MESSKPDVLTPGLKRKQKYAGRLVSSNGICVSRSLRLYSDAYPSVARAFSKLVNSRQVTNKENDNTSSNKFSWRCCDKDFSNRRDIHCHVAKEHKIVLEKITDDILEHGCEDAKWSIMKKPKMSMQPLDKQDTDAYNLPLKFNEDDEYPWLPRYNCLETCEESSSADVEKGRILLFYKYRQIKTPEQIRSWQKELCSRLSLTGKIRVAEEGLNATVGGTVTATRIYMQAVMAHPLFSQLTEEDFKSSEGDASHFPNGLKVGCYKEAVSIGIDPKSLPFDEEGGAHLSPDEFHKAAAEFQSKENDSSKDMVFLDCRNFYESKIGHFSGSLAPNIRKFSYFPEYVDENLDLFRDKSVYMYCTGGIRCERGSVYLKQKGICKDVYQLEGGIHKYIEKYPDGHFKGKMFVFDDRYAITANSEIISHCSYCSEPWDNYQPCTSSHCHQLVLSCHTCRTQKLTACCATCQQHQDNGVESEQCDCTRNRARIPNDTETVS